MTPAMTAAEIELLSAALRPAVRYVEFGSGGSTVLAATIVGESIISVDSSQEWLGAVEQACLEAKTPIMPKGVLVDIGRIRDFGWPIDETARDRWPDYHSSVWARWPEAAKADVFLIDGRFRVACFLQSLLHSDSDCIFMMHDYFSRPYFHIVEMFARVIARADDLAVFVKRASFSSEACYETLTRYTLVAD
jgi:hypothetical protein